MTRPIALLSVSDKRGLAELGQALSNMGFTLVASGGTASLLKASNIDVTTVAELTGAAEILNGRVKTLHPAVHGGILCRPGIDNIDDLTANGYQLIQLVVCNLYPFSEVIGRENATLDMALDNVDIGGVTLLRAAAKTHCRVTVVCDPDDYTQVLAEMERSPNHDTEPTTREKLALKAFLHTADYDNTISVYLSRNLPGSNLSGTGNETSRAHLPLRYGMNPHQLGGGGATLLAPGRGPWAGRLPLTVLGGQPGYINLLDALNGWQLVRELRAALKLPAAASFKHVSPAGAAVAVELDDTEAAVCMVADIGEKLTPLATAYARARSADRLSSFGDFISLSDQCDVMTARVISREVSDGVIAPGYTDEALEILRKKKGGKYCILQMDEDYVPDAVEMRTVYGLRLLQERNNATINTESFNNIVTKSGQKLSSEQLRDLVVATITLKYTQSNSVCLARDGQVVGVGAGQQSRIHCTRLASDKADLWWLRRQPRVLKLTPTNGAKRADVSNAIDAVVRGEAPKPGVLQSSGCEPQKQLELTADERQQWLAKADGFVLSSDAFMPFADNLERARRSGVRVAAAPAGSVNDEAVVDAAHQLGITMVHTKYRLFHH